MTTVATLAAAVLSGEDGKHGSVAKEQEGREGLDENRMEHKVTRSGAKKHTETDRSERWMTTGLSDETENDDAKILGQRWCKHGVGLVDANLQAKTARAEMDPRRRISPEKKLRRPRFFIEIRRE